MFLQGGLSRPRFQAQCRRRSKLVRKLSLSSVKTRLSGSNLKIKKKKGTNKLPKQHLD